MLTHIESCWANTPELQDGWHAVRLSSAKHMPAVINAVCLDMEHLGYPQEDVFGVHLILEEAIVNAIKHGNRADPAKKVDVRYRVSAEHVLMEVEDEGPGFMLSMVPDPTAPENRMRASGRGLLLIRHYATWVRFNKCGNCVTICKCPSIPIEFEPISTGGTGCPHH